jgi:hypothetical protein
MVALSSFTHPTGGLVSFSKTLLLNVSSLRKTSPKAGKAMEGEKNVRSTETILKRNISWVLLIRNYAEPKKKQYSSGSGTNIFKEICI